MRLSSIAQCKALLIRLHFMVTIPTQSPSEVIEFQEPLIEPPPCVRYENEQIRECDPQWTEKNP
jgi:hypothetical protein